MHAYICQIQRQSHFHNAIPNGDWQNLIFIPIRFWVFAIVYLRQHSLFSRHICVCRTISLGFIRSSLYYDAPLSGAKRWKYLEINYNVIFRLRNCSIFNIVYCLWKWFYETGILPCCWGCPGKTWSEWHLIRTPLDFAKHFTTTEGKWFHKLVIVAQCAAQFLTTSSEVCI